LTGSLRAALEELAQGRLGWPQVRTMAEELGWKVRGTDPAVLAEVGAVPCPTRRRCRSAGQRSGSVGSWPPATPPRPTAAATRRSGRST
jgi:hypothetical protein